ncbi:MAG: TetR/AcrR family transcriptional regulator [candidate division WOR-3 bacterium]|nr:MAG: TetR/AcrR family transcriptional regulator [candidate division WOR-3 bacterium]
MAKDLKKEAKKRIFDAAVSLFARKGYAAVGIREIAKKADVNICMINYYYGGKVGILREIINECYEKYYRAITHVDINDIPLEQCVRAIIKNLVAFFRENTESALVAFNALSFDIPEIVDLKTRWTVEYREKVNKFFSQIGLDTSDATQMNFVHGLLTTIVESHFTRRFFYEHIIGTGTLAKSREANVLPEPALDYDDAFYENFTEMLTNFYMHGVTGIATKKHEKMSGEQVCIEK